MRFFRFVLFFMGCFCTLIAGALLYLIHHPLIDLEHRSAASDSAPTIVLDCTGAVWTRFQRDFRDPVAIAHMPQYLINAFITAEDRTFFHHQGVSWRGIGRSLLTNIVHGRIVQGASTITQQLVRLMLLDHRRTFTRKILEQFLSIVIERQYTKEQILEAYLNAIYCGCGIYGVQAASQRFWGISIEKISCAQAATLAAIVRSPGRYCPLIDPEATRKLRNNILKKMHTLKIIDDVEYTAACAEPVLLHSEGNPVRAPHAREMLRQELETLVGQERLYAGGLIVQTTLDPQIQDAAEVTFKKHITQLRARRTPKIDGGMVTIDGNTGAIRALVGGYDFGVSQVNRARSLRQPGSTIKPYIYAAYVEQGHSLSETEIDEPITITQHDHVWKPRNVTREFHGEMTLAHALVTSNNIVSIKTLLKTGYHPIITALKAAGISCQLNEYPSLALGCVDASPLEVVGLFNVFAHAGIYTKPYLISWIKESSGRKLWRHTPEQKRIFSWKTATHVGSVLEESAAHIGSFLGDTWTSQRVMCKTGTTNEARSCWLCAATPSLTTALYLGNDDNSAMKNAFTVRTAAPLWNEFAKIIGHNPELDFSYDPTCVARTLDDETVILDVPTTP